MENTNEFWANASVVAVSPVAFAVGFAKGAYDASTDNGAFSEGFNAAAGPILRGSKKFWRRAWDDYNERGDYWRCWHARRPHRARGVQIALTGHGDQHLSWEPGR